MRKAFENRVDRLWLAFKIGELALAGFQNRQVSSGWLSKLASWLWLAFKISKLALAGFQKPSAQLREICYPIGAKGFELAGFKKLFANSKAFRAKRLSIN